MPCPHFAVTIVSRAKGSSAVAGASYQSGEKLFFDQAQKNVYYRKPEGEVVHKEIMLPANAPPEFENRETLWNSVEDIETQWNSQLARRIHIVLPRELPLETNMELVREYCEKQFRKEGMCVDLCVHDPYPPGHNPHAHVMLTMRSIDKKGRWMPKARKEYLLDENGEKIKTASGAFKSRKVYNNDWNNRGNVERWRHEWEAVQNKYLERAGVPERIDMRSYERQGIDKIPTVHMGPAVAHMEEKGIRTNIGDLNREITHTNNMIASIREMLRSLVEWIATLTRNYKSFRKELREYRAQPTIAELLGEYYQIRSDERNNWSSNAKQKETFHDWSQIEQVMKFLKDNKLYRLPDLHEFLASLEAKFEELRGEVRPAEKRMQEIEQIRSAKKTVKDLAPIHEKYQKTFWKGRKEKYANEHRDELRQFNKPNAFLKKKYGDKPVDLKALSTEYKRLEKIVKAKNAALDQVKADLKQLKDVRYYVSRVLPEEPEPEKVSLHTKLNEAKISKEVETKRGKRPERSEPQQAKKQSQEL